MVIAPVSKQNIAALRELLATMNSQPGVCNPSNPLVPFDAFENLHFARFVILDDATCGDVSVYGIERPDPPVYLAFLGDFDGPYDAFVRELAASAGAGLRRIFSFCDGFDADCSLTAWLRNNECRPSTYYCNWTGRTVRQVREEDKLRRALSTYIDQEPEIAAASAREVHSRLRNFVIEERNAGRLALSPSESTPLVWSLRHAFDVLAFIGIIIIGTLSLVVTWPVLLAIWLKLRSLERNDPEIASRPEPSWTASLARLEDHDVTNQFSAMGSLKPGRFRRYLLTAVLWLVDLTTRVYYTKGTLARVHTIHFARWVYLDNKTRLFFASNYDGSLESYMDDFINKVAIGLNAVFSNGIGYPRTENLLLKGARDEQLFKYFIRRHQLPTEVWYNGHAGLTNSDMERNRRIGQGIARHDLAGADLSEWVALL